VTINCSLWGKMTDRPFELTVFTDKRGFERKMIVYEKKCQNVVVDGKNVCL
jgi:hypothetical protein